MRPFRSAVLSGAVLATIAAPQQAGAQDVQYETVTRVEFAGAAGTVMRAAARLGGGSTETVETTYIKGRRMRTDADESSSIIDLETGRVTILDHGAKTYTSFTFEEMANRAREAGAAADRREETGAKDAQANLDFRFSVDAANERQRVAGYDAERFFLTMEAEAEAVPEGETEMEKAGTLVILTDMWSSKDLIENRE